MAAVNLRTTPAQRTALRKASDGAIESNFRIVARSFRYKRWLPNSNRYRDNCVDKLRKDYPAKVQTESLVRYIAASALPHTLDGWSFLGRALGAQLRGDLVSCRHLAYYAELRAAMGLLAAQGVGIFDNHHYIVDSPNSINLFPPSQWGTGTKKGTKFDTTHVFAWKALEHWSKGQRSSGLLSEIITPGGLSLADWQSGMFSQAGFRVIGRTWLNRWGLDIQQCADDQKLRNQSSYRPSHLNNAQYTLTGERAGFVKEFWRLCEPSGAELFQRLDRHLLRMWLREQYFAIKGKAANSGNPEFMNEISQLVDQVNPQGLTKALWVEFLSDSVKHADSPVISTVNRVEEADASSAQLGMLSRALMLLRLATGASRQLMINSGVDKTDLQFWWHGLGVERALWNDGNQPDEPQSLWLDVEQAIQEIEDWVSTGNQSQIRSFRTSNASALIVIDELERVGLWGIGL